MCEIVKGKRIMGKPDVSRKLESHARFPPWMKYRRITSGPPHVPIAKRIEFITRSSFFMFLLLLSSSSSSFIPSTMASLVS